MSSRSTPQAATPASGLLARFGLRVRQFICGLHGHDTLMHFGPDRVSLVCVSCAYETPGWEVTAAPARKTTPVAPARKTTPVAPAPRVVQMPLGREQRVA